jgi:hypothetical protein
VTWPAATPPAWQRKASLGKLPDRCRIVRPSGDEPTLDPDTLEVTATSVTVYEGPCRIRPRGGLESDQLVGELHETLAPYVGTLPYDTDVRVDDYLTVLKSSDGDLAGRHFQVRHIGWSSYQIDRRVGLEDREQPQGVAGA